MKKILRNIMLGAFIGVSAMTASAATVPNPMEMAKQLPSYYTEGKNGAASNYYVILVTNDDATYSRETGVSMKDGYALFLDFYAGPSTPVSLPGGSYASSTANSEMTYDPNYTYLCYYDADGQTAAATEYQVVGDVKVENQGGGNYTITATIKVDGKEQTVTYSGNLVVSDSAAASGSFTQIKENLDLDLKAGGYAIYEGNLYASNTGEMYINLFTNSFETEIGYMNEDGYCLSLQVFGKLFKDPDSATLESGTYTMSRSFGRYSWYPGMEIEYMGMTGLMGCYVRQRDTALGTYAYSYLADGTIEIEALGGTKYRITVDATTTLGHTVKGRFEGDVPVYNKSVNNTTSALSTLEDDVKLDLAKIKQGHLWNNGEKNGCQCFLLDIGSPSGRDEELKDGGDLMRFEFVLPKGQSTLLPGTYTVMDEKWETMYEPYKLGKGYFVSTTSGGTDLSGTRYMHFIEGRYFVMDHYAPADAGTVGVSKLADGTYKFEINLIDDANFHIDGEWAGPLELMYDPADIDASINEVAADGFGVEFIDANTLRITGARQLDALYNLAGQRMPLQADGEYINISSLAPGVYVVRAAGKSVKFIKQ